MNNKLKKKYKKALDKYNGGNLEKALNLCEECLGETLKFSAVLNLKGLILYQKGDLKGAIATWRINREVNRDELSKTYIQDAKNDEGKLEIYLEAEEKINSLKISEALHLLSECKESDFNCIRVNTALGLCYLRKADYELCKKYVDKALDVDRNYKVARDILKELAIVHNCKIEKNNKKLYGVVFLVALALGVGISGIGKDKGESLEANKPQESVEKSEEVKTEAKKEDIKIEKKLKLKELNLAIKNKDGYEIDSLIEGINKSTLKGEEEKAYNKGIDFLKNKGSVEFYNSGQDYYKKENYKKAKEELIKGAKYGKGIYIYEHTLYYLGLSQMELDESRNAIKTFEDYEKDFPKGVYIEEVLYSLALLNNKEKRLDKAKIYARKLKNNFPKSIYNNENMDKIISK